jgi:tetratricopeptide (TPR) repeat protein
LPSLFRPLRSRNPLKQIKDVAFYNNRAWAYFKAGKAAEGLPDAERPLELRPHDAAALNTRDHIFETLGGHEEAIADYRRAVSKKAGD